MSTLYGMFVPVGAVRICGAWAVMGDGTCWSASIQICVHAEHLCQQW